MAFSIVSGAAKACFVYIILLIVAQLQVAFALVNEDYVEIVKPPRFITVDKKMDGMGSQFQARASCILESRASQHITYIHSPPEVMEHGLKPTDFERFFNLGDNEVPLTEFPDRLNNTLEHIHECHEYSDSNSFMWDLVMPELRRKYFRTPKPVIREFKKGEINVAVHVRGGDIGTCTGEAPGAWDRCIPIPYIVAQITAVKAAVAARTDLPITVHVYSEGDPLFFEPLVESAGAELHLDLDPYYSFHALASASVLVMGHSSFSFSAALINNGLVVYDSFWHPPARRWVRYKSGETLLADDLFREAILQGEIRKVKSRRANLNSST